MLMDPLEAIKPAKDSTIAMLKAAQARGCEVLVFGQQDLWVRDGRAFARLTPLEVVGEGKDPGWYRHPQGTLARLIGEGEPLPDAPRAPTSPQAGHAGHADHPNGDEVELTVRKPGHHGHMGH